MKYSLLLLLLGVAVAQNVRYDAPFPSVSSTNSPFIIANLPPSNPVLAVCHSPANVVPCTNFATTFNGLGIACSNSSQDTPQPAITSSCQHTGDSQGNIGFWAPPGTYDYTVCVSLNCYGPFTVTLSGSVSQPLIFPPTPAPTSFANECASLANGSGGTVTATPMLQIVDNSNIAHDAMCRRSGAVIFPIQFGNGYTFGQGITSGNRTLEVNQNLATGSGRNGIGLTNLSSNNRGSAIQFRSCTGGCGTDFQLFTDFNQTGYEDIALQQGTSQTELYITGFCTTLCPIQYGPSSGANGIPQFLLSDAVTDARGNPEFGLVRGHMSHGTTASTSATDNWGTVTLSGGSGTFSFSTGSPWIVAPICFCNNPNQTGAPIACSASATTTTLTLKSGAGTDTVGWVCYGNPY